VSVGPGELPPLSRPFDVVIAGAGLAGSSLAVRLAKAGARVALVDPGRFPRAKLCGEFLSPEAWGALDRLGLSGAVERSGYHAIRRVHLTTPRGRVLEGDFTGLDGRPGIGLSRSTLDDLLVRQARAAGVEVIEGGPRRWSDRPRRARRRGLGASIGRGDLRDSRHRHRGGERPPFGAGRAHRDHPGPELVAPPPLRHEAAPDRRRSRRRRAGRDGGPAPAPGRICGDMPGRSPPDERLRPAPESSLRSHRGDLDRMAGVLFGGNPRLARLWEAGTPASPWKTVAGVRVEASSPRLAGILYAGDCQGTIDPLGGQGMTMALLGAEVLAPFVMQALAVGPADRRSGAPTTPPGIAGSTAGSTSAASSTTSWSTRT
jgi:hypothetical protein